jgi:RNA recognition motif-containing protein
MGYHLFIDPLPRDFTSEELKALLEKFGSVRSASIAYDSVGMPLGFGRAEMETQEAADNACKHLNRTMFRNVRLTILRAGELDAIP